jgi:hypothetical protein
VGLSRGHLRRDRRSRDDVALFPEEEVALSHIIREQDREMYALRANHLIWWRNRTEAWD